MIARDLQGNDLSWENGNVICDDVLACPVQSLAAGSILGGGKTTMQYNGNDIAWIPIAGDYIVEIVVNAIDDVDPGNDVQQITVSVINWVDIAIDLSWDNNNGGDVMVGTEQADFTLTVVSNGSADNGFNPRNVSVLLKITGDLTSAQCSANCDPADTDIMGTSYLEAGTSGQMVETWRHGEDPNNFTTEARTVLTFQTVWTYQGSVMPDSNPEQAGYSIEASLQSYVDYDAFESCWETYVENNSENGTTETVLFHMCEESQNSDDYPNSNADAITGAKIADDAIDSEHYTDGSIDNAHIADNAIDSEHYADGSIDNAHIADDAIDSEHYADGSIDTAHIADDQVTLAKMAGITRGSVKIGRAHV
jgi:hypothetical protein